MILGENWKSWPLRLYHIIQLQHSVQGGCPHIVISTLHCPVSCFGFIYNLLPQYSCNCFQSWVKKKEAGTQISHTGVSFYQFSSIQFSCSVVSNSLPPHESQHTGPPCPSPTPRVHSNLCPSSLWGHPAISSSVVPFSSCPQSLSASVFSNESTLHMRWPKYWSFSFSIIPSKELPGLISFRMDWLDLLAVQGTLKSLYLDKCKSLAII